ncbi:MAG: aminotransferase class I/II-fold pyridoxal phosphate-dependent enzyme [Sphingobacteriia bacterium]|nr:MAG: aminotransferase class I/II-fold pyridoxal phosphate-dependent enzyme [Sphingobacteriia bacterium]TAG31590.1 MAG: aminotransferase class I/II-fold pyridoxal phosphate-dependent enzyme [Sphingobacteriia bacterium]
MNKKTKKTYTGIGTTAIHASANHKADHSHLTPIYASSTFTFDTAAEGSERFAGSDKTKIYSRWGNPGFAAAEVTIAALETFGLKDEKGNPLEVKALLHSSGQAALTTLFLGTLKTGDMVLSHRALYGGTHELLHKVLATNGIQTLLIDLNDAIVLEQILTDHPTIQLIHIETPSNPTLRCIDIEAVCKIAHSKGKKVSVDNTAATPYLQQPFKWGADFVMHSTTKFLNGHGNAIGGILIGKDLELMNGPIWKWHVLLGGNSNPFDAFLLLNGLKTLELRMERHCHNAVLVANYLAEHPAVEKVNFCGLATHPDHAIALKQMRQAGALMSFELKGGIAAGSKFIDQLQLCVKAISFGTPDTLLSHPASMSHLGLSKEERLQYEITDGLIRLSVGIEQVEDIIADFEQALAI